MDILVALHQVIALGVVVQAVVDLGVEEVLVALEVVVHVAVAVQNDEWKLFDKFTKV